MSVDVVVNVSDLAEMVEQVWMAYLDPEGVHPLTPAGDEERPSDVHSSVSITGSWTGHVVYASSAVAATRAAAAFLTLGIDEVSPEDVADVLGELANMSAATSRACCRPAPRSRCRGWCCPPSR